MAVPRKVQYNLKSNKKKPKVRFGALKGKIKLAHDFDAPLPAAILVEFEHGLKT
jgi:hypothetical protein